MTWSHMFGTTKETLSVYLVTSFIQEINRLLPWLTHHSIIYPTPTASHPRYLHLLSLSSDVISNLTQKSLI